MASYSQRIHSYLAKYTRTAVARPLPDISFLYHHLIASHELGHAELLYNVYIRPALLILYYTLQSPLTEIHCALSSKSVKTAILKSSPITSQGKAQDPSRLLHNTSSHVVSLPYMFCGIGSTTADPDRYYGRYSGCRITPTC